MAFKGTEPKKEIQVLPQSTLSLCSKGLRNTFYATVIV